MVISVGVRFSFSSTSFLMLEQYFGVVNSCDRGRAGGLLSNLSLVCTPANLSFPDFTAYLSGVPITSPPSCAVICSSVTLSALTLPFYRWEAVIGEIFIPWYRSHVGATLAPALDRL
jgi:hypothetical protein